MVTAGLAKQVEEVKRVAEIMNNPTVEGIFFGLFFSATAITIRRPVVANNSATIKLFEDLSTSDK